MDMDEPFEPAATVEEKRAKYSRSPQKNLKELELIFFIPGLQPPKTWYGRRAEPVSVTYYNRGLSMELKADVKEYKKKKEIIHRYKRVIRRFPSPVDINRCEYQIKKGEIHVVLRKKEEVDWEPFIDARGLDQLDSDEDSPVEDTIEGAAAATAKAAQPKFLSLEEFAGGITRTLEVHIPKHSDEGDKEVTRVISTVFTKRLKQDDHVQNIASGSKPRPEQLQWEGGGGDLS